MPVIRLKPFVDVDRLDYVAILKWAPGQGPGRVHHHDRAAHNDLDRHDDGTGRDDHHHAGVARVTVAPCERSCSSSRSSWCR